MPMKGDKFIFPIADGTVKLFGGSGSESIHLNSGIAQTEEKNKVIFKENQKDLFQTHFKTHRGMMVKPGMISGPFHAILFTVIT